MGTSDNTQSPFSAFVFHLRKYIHSTELQHPAEEISHMLSVSFWSTLLPEATCRLRQYNSLPVPSDDVLRQGLNNHAFKERLRASCSPAMIVLLMSKQSTLQLGLIIHRLRLPVSPMHCFSFHAAYTKIRYSKCRVLELKTLLCPTPSV